MLFRRLALSLALVAVAFPVAAGKPETLSAAEAKKRDAVEHFLRAKLLIAESEFEAALKEFRKAVELDPEDGGLRREYADFLSNLSIWSEAEQEARKAVQLAPGNPGARRLLGQILLAGAKDKPALDAAAAELKAANEAQPYEPSGALAYAQVLLKLEQHKEAATVLERVLDRGRGQAIPLLYGEALEKSGQLEQAEELYGALLAQDPENRAAALALLRVYERQRRFDKAVPILQAFLKAQPGNLGIKTEMGSLLLRARRFPDAAKLLSEVLKADPGNREALRTYAVLLSETRENDKADEVLAKLEKLEPEDDDIPFRRALNFLDAHRVEEAEKVLLALRERLVSRKKGEAELSSVDGQLGYAAYLRKDYEAARKRLQPRLFDSDGVNAQAFSLLLQIARDTNDPAEGLRLAREVHQKSSAPGATAPSVTVRASLGEFLFRSDDPKDKVEGERLLVELAKADRAGVLAAADAWQRLELYSRSADVARAGLAQYKEDPDLLFRLAASLEREKKISESVAAFERLLNVRGDHAQGLNYLGYLWAERGENLDKALELIRKAVDLDPSNGAYLDSLGWVYYQMNKLDLAEEYLQNAVVLEPEDSTVLEHLGDLYEKKGNVVKARELWQRARLKKPDDGGKKLEQKLQRTEHTAGKK